MLLATSMVLSSVSVAPVLASDEVKDTSENYTFTLENDAATEVGTYVAKVTAVKDTSKVDITKNVNVKNPTFEWKIVGKTKTKVRIAVDTNGLSAYYGESKESVLKKLSKDNLVFEEEQKNGTWKKLTGSTTPTAADMAASASGTPTFDTSYDPYLDAGTNVWSATYTGGLEAEDYEFVATTVEAEKKGAVVAVPVIVTAKSFTVGVDAEKPESLKDGYELADGAVNPTASKKVIKGGAEALARDIADGYIKVTVDTTAYDGKNAKGVGKYPITVTFDDQKSKKSVNNFTWWTMSAGNQVLVNGDDKAEHTDGTTTAKVTNANKFELTWGDFSLEFDDVEVAYDGKMHTIKMTPATLPEGVDVYFMDAVVGSDDETAIKAMYEGNVDTWKSNAVKNVLPERAEAGKYAVYMYIDAQDKYKVTKWGKQKLTITSSAEGVKKAIDEAATPDAEGNLDPEKIQAAREAYEALSDAEKAKVPTASVRKLEDAEKAVKDQTDAKAAKAVEDEIDKLPAATEATAADKEAADKAVEDYNKLTDDQKKLVPEDKVKKMNDVKAAADAAGEEADKKAAKAVEDKIAALPAAADAKASDKAAADEAKAAYDALTDAQKALVPAEAVDKMNAVKAAADEAAEKEKEAKEEVAALDEKVAAVKAAKNGADGKKAAEDAKDAYDKLSDEAKALMTDEEKAAYEATQEAYKKDKTFESGEGVFRVLSNGEVTFTKPLHPENTWFVVPNQVKKNGFMYKVVKVSTKAFMGCEKATKIKIGKNVQSIGAYAFKNTPAMGKLIMLTSKLASGKVKDSFVSGGKDKGAKLTNEVPNGKTSAYESLFKGEGGMNAGAKFTEAD